MTEELQKKVDRAVKLIQAAGKMAKEHGQPLEIAYSGGKDSDVILELARMSGADIRPIYKNTTIDPPGTIAHAIANGCEVVRPKESFFQLLAKHGYPNRLTRFCCRHLKEYKILDYAVIGIRRNESTKRAARYKEPEVCRVYNKKEKTRQYLPILEWTAQDVADFIKERGIKCHSLYYDEQGEFHPERRLGCMCCPLAYKPKRIADFKKYPNIVKAYLRAGQKFRASHPDGKNAQMFPDVYTWFVRDVFYPDVPRKWEELNSGMFEHPDYKQFIEQYFNITLKL